MHEVSANHQDRRSGVVQRGIAGVVACVRVDPGIDKRVDGGDITAFGGVAQLELAVHRKKGRGKCVRGDNAACVYGLAARWGVRDGRHHGGDREVGVVPGR